MTLFVDGPFIARHKKGKLPFKIECEALSPADWATMAHLVASKIPFETVHGVPRGGLPFAEALKPFAINNGVHLTVDDVLTTGGSIRAFQEEQGLTGGPVVTLFSRGPCPENAIPVFKLNSKFW